MISHKLIRKFNKISKCSNKQKENFLYIKDKNNKLWNYSMLLKQDKINKKYIYGLNSKRFLMIKDNNYLRKDKNLLKKNNKELNSKNKFRNKSKYNNVKDLYRSDWKQCNRTNKSVDKCLIKVVNNIIVWKSLSLNKYRNDLRK